MYGYIYKTTNIVSGKVYIGQRKAERFIKSYYGSGVALKDAIKSYGKEYFKVEFICEAESQSELDKLEIEYIKKYRESLGRDNVYNIMDGGHPSGVYYLSLSKNAKEEFVKKMTKINRERCNTEEFKQKLSKATRERYKDPEERKAHAIKVKETWKNPELRKKQSEYLKAYYKDKKRDCSFNYKRCAFELNGIFKEFESVKDLFNFLATNYNYHPDRRTQMKLFEMGSKRIPFKSLRKKFSCLDGMLIYKL